MQHYIYKITAFSNYDGDSFDLTLDLGFDLIVHKKTRIMGVDTPELRGGTVESKAAGQLAKHEATAFVSNAMIEGNAYFSSEGYTGKFGRPLGDIVDAAGNSLRKYLIDNHLGVPYEGQAKREIQSLHDVNLAILKEEDRI